MKLIARSLFIILIYVLCSCKSTEKTKTPDSMSKPDLMGKFEGNWVVTSTPVFSDDPILDSTIVFDAQGVCTYPGSEGSKDNIEDIAKATSVTLIPVEIIIVSDKLENPSYIYKRKENRPGASQNTYAMYRLDGDTIYRSEEEMSIPILKSRIPNPSSTNIGRLLCIRK